ncbi:hypothetical protein ES703_50469 [subsurface metagenome]
MISFKGLKKPKKRLKTQNIHQASKPKRSSVLRKVVELDDEIRKPNKPKKEGRKNGKSTN